MKAVQKLKSIAAVVGAAFLVLCSGGAAPATTSLADELHSYESTSIEDDLRDVDLSGYVKDESAQHRLLDNVGFVEYGYSESPIVTMNYYGIYLYVYNPTEREVSTQPGANKVNIAVEYVNGKPSDYENLPLTLLDCTDNHRFYKFRITDSAKLLSNAQSYAKSHNGERRYDVAGVQLWFKGDINATDETDDRTARGKTFTFTGYAAGCGASTSSGSTLSVNTNELETVSLDVKKTFYRTKSSDLGEGYQKQIDSVYFTVPKRYIEEYGKLQRIKAEWYEYKTSPVVVTSNPDFYYAAAPYVGMDTTKLNPYGFADCGYAIAKTSHSSAPSGIVSAPGNWLFWNYPLYLKFYNEGLVAGGTAKQIPLVEALKSHGITSQNYISTSSGSGGFFDDDPFSRSEYYDTHNDVIPALYYFFHTKDWCDIDNYDPSKSIEEQGGIKRSDMENWIYNYDKSYDRGVIQIGEKTLSADLFESDIDESRKKETEYGKIQQGYSYYDFDADADIHEILTYQPENHSFSENYKMYGFWRALFHTYGDQVEEVESISPILILKEQDLAGNNETVSSRLKVHVDDVSAIKEEYERAVNGSDGEEKVVVLFRFAVSDYYHSYLEIQTVDIDDAGVISSETVTYKNSEGKREEYSYEAVTHSLNAARNKDTYGQAYVAQESVFLDFDIIQLSFQREGESKLSVIPVRANPIDIIDPITPPWQPEYGDFWALVWILLGVIGGLVAALIGTKLYEKHKENKNGRNG